ncbi:MAG TPA: TolC family protein [Bacteroidetes bacterium]|nr:TolC family protein [Bacteroidota bacterium]
MKRLLSYIPIILVLWAGNVQAQEALGKYLQIAGENNPGLKAKFSAYYATLEKIPQAKALPDPRVSFGYFVSPIETRVGPQRAKLGVSQLFPWFGTLKAKENVVIQLAKARYEAFEQAKSKLFLEIRSAYFQLYFIQKGIDITNENMLILNTFQQLAVIKIETGKVSVVDELRVEMEINELKNQRSYLQDSKLALEVKFNKLLNRQGNLPIRVPDTLWSRNIGSSKTELLDSILGQNHLLKQLEYKIRSWKKQEEVAKKLGKPQVSVGIDYAIIGKSANPNLGKENGRDALFLPKVGISIPLYRKKYRAKVKEAIFNMESNEYQRENQQNELVALFEMGFKDYQDADRRIELYRRQLQLAEKSLNILLVSYSSDGENFEEVLRMERKVLKYALEFDKARADKNAAVAFFDYLIGK